MVRNEINDREISWHHLNYQDEIFLHLTFIPKLKGPSSLVLNLARQITPCLVRET